MAAWGGSSRCVPPRPIARSRDWSQRVCAARTEPGDSGPRRIVHRVTPAGAALRRWLGSRWAMWGSADRVPAQAGAATAPIGLRSG